MDCARALGADVPVCLAAKPRLMRGIGHDLGPELPFYFDQPALLVHPGVGISTRAAYAALGLRPGERLGGREAPVDAIGRVPILGMLEQTRNDLEAAAFFLAPSVATALMELRALEGCQFARMSGSGATCFGLFATIEAARAAAVSLANSHPEWWIRPVTLKMPF
jgi:4-diphosphocytidyl-2-C-methyl-D-erythritol kinase